MWYYVVDGQSKGPLSEAELDALISSGALPTSTLVFREGMTDWQAYSTARQPKPGLRLHKTAASAAPAMVPQEDGSELPASELASQAAAAYQQKSRRDTFTAWGTVGGVLACMFLFLGMLAAHQPASLIKRSRPTANINDTDNSLEAPAAPANRRIQSSPGSGRAGMVSVYMSLKGGMLKIENRGQFDWPATTVQFNSNGEAYRYQLDGLRQGDSVSISVSRFKTKDGKTLGLFTATPKEYQLELQGMGKTTIALKRG